jgi:hypothetical protein
MDQGKIVNLMLLLALPLRWVGVMPQRGMAIVLHPFWMLTGKLLDFGPMEMVKILVGMNLSHLVSKNHNKITSLFFTLDWIFGPAPTPNNIVREAVLGTVPFFVLGEGGGAYILGCCACV